MSNKTPVATPILNIVLLLFLLAGSATAQLSPSATLLNPESATQPDKLPLTRATDRPTSPVSFLEEFGKPTYVSPQDLLVKVLEGNLQIQIEGYDESIAADVIQQRKGIYDSNLIISGSQSRQTNQSRLDPERVLAEQLDAPGGSQSSSLNRFTNIITNDVDDRRAKVELQQLFSTGAQISLDSESSRVKQDDESAGTSFNPLITRTYNITVEQPLLKNFGPFVTNAQINIAKKQFEFASLAFRNQVQVQVAEILKQYWDLVFAIGNTEVNRLSLEQAAGLRDVNQAKLIHGVVDPVTVLQAEAGVATREGQFISSKSQVRDVQDQIIKIINYRDEAWTENIIPIDVIPEIVEYPINIEQYFDEAYNHRPDFHQIQIQQEILEITERVGKNQLLPELNLLGSYGLVGIDNSHSRAESTADTQDFDNWSVGLEFRYPLQNRDARSLYSQARKDTEQGLLEIEDLRHQIIQQVRVDSRAIETNRKLIDLALTSINAEKAKLDAEQRRFAEGLSTSQALLDFQEDLQQARTEYLRVIVDYNKAIINLERDKGTLLQAVGIQIQISDPFQ